MNVEVSRLRAPGYRGPLDGSLERLRTESTSEFALPTSLRDLAIIVFKWKWSIVTIVVTGLIGTLFWLFVVRDDAYEVSSKILVKIGHEQTSSTTLNARPIAVIGERAQDVNSEVDILQNKELVGQVIDYLGMGVPSPPPPYPTGRLQQLRWHVKDLSSRFREWQNEILIWVGMRPRLTYRERVLALLSDGLIVTPQRDSNVIVARMFVGVREGGGTILNTIVDFYLKHRLSLWKGQGAEEYFAAHMERSRTDLQSAEASLRSFEQTHNIVAIQKQQEVLLASIAAEEERVRTAGIAMEDANEKLKRMTAELSKPEPAFAMLGEFQQGSFSDTVMQQLSAIERQREQLRMTELDGDLRVQNLKSQYKLLLRDVVNNVAAAAAERTAAYQTRIKALGRMREELQQLHARELEWSSLKRTATMAEQSYLGYRDKVQESSGVSELETRHIGNVVVIERATDALRPAGTRKQTLLAAAFAVILFAAFAWIAVAEFFDHRIYSSELLEGLVGAPTIGTIPAARAARLRFALRPAPAQQSLP